MAAGKHATFGLADLDVLENLVVCTLIHHRSSVEVLRGIALLDCRDALLQPLAERVVDLCRNNGARTRRALLPVEPERARNDAVQSGVEVAVRLDDDGVPAAHLEHCPLD